MASIVFIANADNPIITQKYTADPNAIVYNNRVYVFCSHDDNNPDNGFNIIDYTLVSSDDMANWTDHGEVFKVPRDASWCKQAYAPGAVVKNNKVYLYFPDGGSQIGVAVADRPEGPFTDPIKKALINKSMTNCNVEWLFDPAAFVDTDGQAYLYFGGGGSTPGNNLRVIKLNPDMISTNGTAVTISAPRSFEAAFMHKYKDTYFFQYSNDFKGPPNAQIAYMTGKSPMPPFTFRGSVLDNPALDGTNINMGNNNHASIVEYKDKCYIFYHDRRLSNQTYKRSVSVDVVTFNSDNTLYNLTKVTKGVAQIKNLNPYDTVQAETINLQKGIKTDVCSEGGIMVNQISSGDYIHVKGVDFGKGAAKFQVRAASGSSGGTIELRLGSETGTLVGTCTIAGTGGWTTWKTFECEVSNCSEVKDLYLVFKGSDEPYRLNWYRFIDGSTPISSNVNKAKQINDFKVNCSNSIIRADFSAQDNGTAFLSVYNLSGEIVKNVSFNTSAGQVYSKEIDLSVNPAGYYMVKIDDGKNMQHVSKVLITK
jgi:arabinoxylan arabinofuranohydrolase